MTVPVAAFVTKSTKARRMNRDDFEGITETSEGFPPPVLFRYTNLANDALMPQGRKLCGAPCQIRFERALPPPIPFREQHTQQPIKHEHERQQRRDRQ